MKKIYSLLVVLLFAHAELHANIFPMSNEGEDKPLHSKQSIPGVNLFTPDWFIGGGAGIGVYYGDHNKQMKFGERIAPNFDLYVGRWLNNSFGVRLGANGVTSKGATQNGANSTGERYTGKPWEGYWLEKQKFNYLYVHADLLFHWTNDIYLTEVDRFYDIIPYAGIGVMTTLGGDYKATRISPNLGVMQTFRLSEKLALVLDIRGNIVGDGMDGEKGGNNFEGTSTATLGVKYTFRK